MNIITVDAGKYQTKGLFDGKGIKFRTKLEEIDESIRVRGNNSFHIQWEDKHYLIGEGAKYVDYDVSKHKLQHKLATYSACAKLLKDQKTKYVNLVVLSPLTTYTNPQAREEFRQYILNDNKAEFEIDGTETRVTINDVTVFAEAIGVSVSNIDKFKDKTVGVLDIGGLNVNGIIIKNMKPIRDTEFTINAGSLIIMEKVRKELNREIRNANIQEYQMDTIMKQGLYNGEVEISKEIIQSILSNHFKDIIQITKANNWDMQGLDIVITGGGSLDLGLQNIKNYIPQAQLSNNPVWDSCIGGNKVGAMLYE
mgnify:CR=1 FL=1